MVMDEHPAIRVNEDSVTQFMDHVIREDGFKFYLNNQFLTEQIASAENLRELGAGFVICEGLADHVESVSVNGSEIWIEADAKGPIDLEYRSSGGCGIKRVPKTVTSSFTITRDEVYRITEAIESETWKKTGGVHCSVLFSNDRQLTQMCDIGRHNTVDKVVGFTELAGIDRSQCCIGCTGRQPAGMVAKDANAGIPIVISRAASTNRGILTAEQTGITLICFSRKGRFTIYANPQRVEGIMHHLNQKP
jgi:FdhD protein